MAKSNLSVLNKKDIPEHYNSMFMEFTQGTDNIRGLLAYAAYKKEKYEWIQSYRNEHGKPPSEDDIKSYFLLPYKRDGKIRQLYEAADQGLQKAFEKMLEAKIQELNDDFEKAVLNITKNISPSPWYTTVSLNLLSGIIAAGLILMAYLVPHYGQISNSLSSLVKESIDNTIMLKTE